MTTVTRNGHDITFDEALARQWIDALRSGEYKQGTNRLRPTERTYCCLGVVCDLIDSGGWEKDKDGEYRFHYRKGLLPQTVTGLVGLTEDGSPVTPKIPSFGWKTWRTLSEANDHGATFAEIADALEQYYFWGNT